MTYTIYGDLRSGAFSSEAALAEAGADYRFEIISLDKNDHKKPEFLAINPSGKGDPSDRRRPLSRGETPAGAGKCGARGSLSLALLRRG